MVQALVKCCDSYNACGSRVVPFSLPQVQSIVYSRELVDASLARTYSCDRKTVRRIISVGASAELLAMIAMMRTLMVVFENDPPDYAIIQPQWDEAKRNRQFMWLFTRSQQVGILTASESMCAMVSSVNDLSI